MILALNANANRLLKYSKPALTADDGTANNIKKAILVRNSAKLPLMIDLTTLPLASANQILI